MFKKFIIFVLAIMLSSCELSEPSEEYYYQVGSLEPDWSFLGSVMFESVDMNVVGEYYVIYEKDNKQHQAKVVINDTMEPRIVLKGESEVHLTIGSEFIDSGYIVTDNYDSFLEVEVTSDLDINTLGDFTVTYSVTDSSGNSFSVTRVIHVIEEEVILTLNGEVEIELDKGSEYIELGASVNNDSEVLIEGYVDTSVIGTYYIKYTVEDIVVVRTVNVVDTEIIVTLIGEVEIDLELGFEYTELGVTVNKDLEVLIEGYVDTFTPGTYYIKYIVADTMVIRTINVIDTVKTIITLIGEEELNIEVGSEYTELGALVNKDSEIVIESSVNSSILGTYNILYIVNDVEVVRTIHVVDTIKPTLELNGSNVTLGLGESYFELGIEVTDNYDTELDVIINTNLDITKVGEYTVTYTVTDSSGNISEATRIINVIDDILPEIELVGKKLVYLDYGSNYYEEGVIASDNSGEVEVIILGEVKINISGVYHLVYKAIDKSQNESIVVRTVVVNERIKETIYNVGDTVYFSGTYYADSEGSGPSGSIEGEYVIEKKVDALYPYLLKPLGGTAPYGWTDGINLRNVETFPILDELVINQNLLDTSNKKVGYEMNPTYIVIHNTANIASAYNEIAYLHNEENDTFTSFHFAVDESEIWQGVDLNYNAWHAGDGEGDDSINRNSIGIEVARSLHEDESIRERATNLSAMLTAKLMLEYNIGIENVITHHDVSGKYCPHEIFDSLGWDNYIKLIESYLE